MLVIIFNKTLIDHGKKFNNIEDEKLNNDIYRMF